MAAERQADSLDHLVGPARGEHLLGAHAVQRTDGAPQLHGRAVRVALERQLAQLVEKRLPPRVGRRIRRLVGVQPYRDVDLW